MFDAKQFRAAICLAGLKTKDVAYAMGISKSTLYRKLNGKTEFTREEIQRFCDYVKPADMCKIFFS